MFGLRAAVFLAWLVVVAGSCVQPVLAQNKSDPDKVGVAVVKDPDGNNGITANDVIGLIDGKLGTNYGSLTLVFGGCYSDAFTAAANNSAKLKSGNVAVMSATGAKGACYTPGSPLGNPFVNGIIDGFAGGNTAGQAFTQGESDVQRFEKDEHNKDKKTGEALKLTNPEPTYFGNGKTITLKGDPKKQYAIIFVGVPDSFADWNDAAKQFQALVDEGWDPKHISVFFGDSSTNVDGPMLPNGVSAAADAKANNKTITTSYQGPKGKDTIYWSPATFANLKTKLTQWAAFAKLEEVKPAQFYILFAGHSTNDATKRKNLLTQLVQPSAPYVVPRPANPLQPAAGGELAAANCPGCLVGWPSNVSLEASAFGGAVSTTSFGNNYDTSLFGARFAAAAQNTQGLRVQFDLEGEGTGAYCPRCDSRDYVAGGVHADWSIRPNLEIGVFGGMQTERPTFGAPKSTNAFGGGEARVFTPYAMFGGSVGYFDVVGGPGTLTSAWFAEGRAKFDLGYAFGAARGRGPTLAFGAGYASGNVSTALNPAASTTNWYATLAAPVFDLPVQGFIKYSGYNNRVDGLGTVWAEHAVTGGFQLNLGCQCDKSLEAMMPLPTVLRTVMTF